MSLTPAPTNQSNPILSYYKEWSERTPFITRYAVISMIITYIFSFFFEFDRQLGNIPYFTIFYYEIYRIVLSPLVGNSFLSILMILLFFPTMGGRIESSIGSGSYLHLIFLFTVIINVSFDIICLILYILGVPEAFFWNCSGFWSIIFAFITLECLQMPEVPRQIMFIPVNIPSKYFPAVLYLFFVIFSGPDLGLAIAILIGYIHFNGYLDRLRPTSYYLASLETPQGLFYNISRSYGWVLAGASLGHDSWIPVNTNVDSQPENGTRSTGNWRSVGQSSTTATPLKDQSPFTGPGRLLSSSSYQSTGSSMTKEAMAEKRLAALGSSNVKQAQVDPNQSNALDKLLEMGFLHSDAVRALEKSNGDLNVAMQILTS